MDELIRENIHALRQELSDCARDPDHPPILLPVTKNREAQEILALSEEGIRVIGENRAQEIVDKYPVLSKDFDFHMIGRLQTNKIKYIMDRVCMIQSLDRWPLAEAIDARAKDAGRVMPVLVQVNIGAEPQKAGVPPEETERFVRDCAGLSGIAVRGLMAIMPFADDPETIRPLFRSMRALFERLRAQAISGVEMVELSMGMSGDYRVAAQEGATMVRIGSAIFGPRAVAARSQL